MINAARFAVREPDSQRAHSIDGWELGIVGNGRQKAPLIDGDARKYRITSSDAGVFVCEVEVVTSVFTMHGREQAQSTLEICYYISSAQRARFKLE